MIGLLVKFFNKKLINFLIGIILDIGIIKLIIIKVFKICLMFFFKIVKNVLIIWFLVKDFILVIILKL